VPGAVSAIEHGPRGDPPDAAALARPATPRHELPIHPDWSTTMPTFTHPPQTRSHSAPAYYQARAARGQITAPHRRAHQLIRALARRARRLHLPRPGDYKLEPMPRMRWYS
jgi:hypothetical protein